MTPMSTSNRVTFRRCVMGHRNRDYSMGNAGDHYSDQDLREVVDLYCEGHGVGSIADRLVRKGEAIGNVLRKVISKYDEDGKREDYVSRLRRVKSRLAYDRPLVGLQELMLFCMCYDAGRSLADMCAIFHASPRAIRAAERLRPQLRYRFDDEPDPNDGGGQ